VTIRRRALTANPDANDLAAFLIRKELTCRFLRRRPAPSPDPGPGAGFSGTLSGFPEPGTGRSEA